MNLSQIETELAALRNKHSQAAGQLALLQSQKTTKAAELSSAQIDITTDRKSTRLNSSHIQKSRMPSSA